MKGSEGWMEWIELLFSLWGVMAGLPAMLRKERENKSNSMNGMELGWFGWLEDGLRGYGLVGQPMLRKEQLTSTNKPTKEREWSDWGRKQWMNLMELVESNEFMRHDERTQWSGREAKPASRMAPAQQIKNKWNETLLNGIYLDLWSEQPNQFHQIKRENLSIWFIDC